MKTFKKIRVEIVVEHLALDRLTQLLEGQEHVHGYTIIPVHGGSGTHGTWTRNGLISDTEGMMMVISVLDEQHKDDVLSHLFEFLENRIAIVTVLDVEVMRRDHF